MLVYQDLLTGDELLSDSYPAKEIENGMLWEVEGKWVVKGAVDVNIGANPSAEGGEDEGVDDTAVKVVDIVDVFRLQEQPPFDKKQFLGFVKKYIKLLTPKLDAEKQEHFKKNIEGATKYLLGKLKDLQFFVGESMHDDGSLVFAYYKDGAADPTFLYFAHILSEEEEKEEWEEGQKVHVSSYQSLRKYSHLSTVKEETYEEGLTSLMSQGTNGRKTKAKSKRSLMSSVLLRNASEKLEKIATITGAQSGSHSGSGTGSNNTASAHSKLKIGLSRAAFTDSIDMRSELGSDDRHTTNVCCRWPGFGNGTMATSASSSTRPKYNESCNIF